MIVMHKHATRTIKGVTALLMVMFTLTVFSSAIAESVGVLPQKSVSSPTDGHTPSDVHSPTDVNTPTDVTKPAEKPQVVIPVDNRHNAVPVKKAVIKGMTPEEAEGITVTTTVPDTKTEGPAKTAFEAAAQKGEVLAFYDIKLVDEHGNPITLKDGQSLELTLSLGKQFANRRLIIRHYNSEIGEFVEAYEVTADAEGNVIIEVTSLSYFAVQDAPAKTANPKTGDGAQVALLCSIALAAGVVLVVMGKRQLSK